MGTRPHGGKEEAYTVRMQGQLQALEREGAMLSITNRLRAEPTESVNAETIHDSKTAVQGLHLSLIHI